MARIKQAPLLGEGKRDRRADFALDTKSTSLPLGTLRELLARVSDFPDAAEVQFTVGYGDHGWPAPDRFRHVTVIETL